MAPGVQIPGLGFAKPDEKLPPLSSNTDNTSTSQVASIDDIETEASMTVAEDTDVSSTVVGDTGTTGSDQVQSAASLAASTDNSNLLITTAAGDIDSDSDSSSSVSSSSSSDSGSATPAATQSIAGPAAEAPALTSALEAALGRLPPNSKGRKRLAEDPGSTWLLEDDRGEKPEWEFDDSPYQSDESAGPEDERYVPMSAEELRREFNKEVGGWDGSDGSDGEKRRQPKNPQQQKPIASQKKATKKEEKPKDKKSPMSVDSQVEDTKDPGEDMEVSSSSSGSEDDGDDDAEYESVANAIASLNTHAESSPKAKKVGTKNELNEPKLPKPTVEIQENDEIGLLGYYLHTVEHQVVLQGAESFARDRVTLEIETVVCTEDRQVVGAVADIIGSLSHCYYVVHIDESTIATLQLERGTKLYYVVKFAKPLDTNALRAMKGSDASNQHDEEVDWASRDFSDDEEEKAYKASMNKKKRENKLNARGGSGSRGGGRGGPVNPHPLSQTTTMPSNGSLPYDDDDNNGDYTPLKRPTNFGQSSSTNSAGRGGNANRGRGGNRGRGSDRGGPRNASSGYSLPPQGQQQYAQQPAQPNQSNWNPNQQGFPQYSAQPQFAAPPNFPMFPPPPAVAGSNFVPPPPPGWPVQQPGGSNQQGNPQFNAAALQAMMAHMQQFQGQNNPQGPNNNQRQG